jgi:hypothetical protein
VGEIRDPEPVLPIVALLARDEAALEAARAAAARIVGPLDLLSPVFPFEWTSYYEAEMGPGLLRQLAAAARLADPGELAGWKLRAQEEERAILGLRAASRGSAEDEPGNPAGRPANIDPGYLGGAKLVLASTKDFAHRVYLGAGIYAEVTLRFARGAFEPLPWTYPDFRSGRYADFLLEARRRYRARLGEVRG